MKTETTNRGFGLIHFTDANDVACSLQESSAAREEGLIWLGCDEIGLKKFVPYKGWSDVELENDAPNGVVHTANTRMHLTQSQVRGLLPALQYFAEHGVLPKEMENGR